jgi:hypothetical protein
MLFATLLLAASVLGTNEFAVCVTTVDSSGVSRFDSYHDTQTSARARRSQIVTNGWIVEDPFNKEDEYPPRILRRNFLVRGTRIDNALQVVF